MVSSVSKNRTARKGRHGGSWFRPGAFAWLTLILPIASCVPAAVNLEGPHLAAAETAAMPAPPSAASMLPAPAGAAPATPLIGLQALAANAAMRAAVAGPAASGYVFAARTPIDQMRSLDCLAQAVYYEARSESEDGQRAVAQVVINRVRHPAWPNSVCGVVYQGPMRAGGGCQFTFTCDGSLAAAPAGEGWARARRIAADALAGYTFAAVGLSTHYHANYVFPSWAPRLIKTAAIGAHEFYRLPGLAGAPGAFSAAYAGSEPVPHPAAYLRFRAAPSAALAAYAPAGFASAPQPAPVPSDIPQDARWTANVPDSTIRDEFRQSGQWRMDAPGAVTGGR
jgi:spore germination cell wall hydrolase CwlJ-like protein